MSSIQQVQQAQSNKCLDIFLGESLETFVSCPQRLCDPGNPVVSQRRTWITCHFRPDPGEERRDVVDLGHPVDDGQDNQGWQQCKEYRRHKKPDSEGHGHGSHSRYQTCKYFHLTLGGLLYQMIGYLLGVMPRQYFCVCSLGGD